MKINWKWTALMVVVGLCVALGTIGALIGLPFGHPLIGAGIGVCIILFLALVVYGFFELFINMGHALHNKVFGPHNPPL